MDILLRKATMDDGELLLRWRNDPRVYQYYFNPTPVARDEHFAWLRLSLEGSSREIYIAETGGKPVGMLRADKSEDKKELSWAVDPDMQGKGIGTVLLKEGRKLFAGELIAEIKSENIASIKIVEIAGFQRAKEENGILYYSSL
jgi:RimJ/RimL family protein N-acetyltransferase